MSQSRLASNGTDERIAVIGASGFIGSRVVWKLRRTHAATTTAIVRRDHAHSTAQDLGATVCRADLSDSQSLTAALEGHSIVINTAHDFQASEDENRRGFANLLDACVAAKVSRLVHTSSIVVYDDWPEGALDESSPRSESGFEYKRAKVAMERMLRERAESGELDSIALQPTIVYGPGGWIWTESILERLETGTVILPEACEGACHAVYVDDVADALIGAASCDAQASGPSARSFIISGPAPTTWRAFFSAYDHIIGRNSLRFETIEAPASKSSDGDAPSASGIARIAQSESIRGLVRRLRKALGEDRVKRIRQSLLQLRRRSGPIEYWPRPDEVALYGAKGSCSIEGARRVLGYQPRFDFELGVAEIEDRRSRRSGALADTRDADA